MLSELTGKLVSVTPPELRLDVQGATYTLTVSMQTVYALANKIQTTISLLTLQRQRDDETTLFGFLSENERFAFKKLTSIQGLGPRTAMGILSSLSAEELSDAALTFNTGALTRIPGVGPQTAEAILNGLKGALAEQQASQVVAGSSSRADAAECLEILVSMGYAPDRSNAAIRNIPAQLDKASALRHALAQLVDEKSQ